MQKGGERCFHELHDLVGAITTQANSLVLWIHGVAIANEGALGCSANLSRSLAQAGWWAWAGCAGRRGGGERHARELQAGNCSMT